MGDFDLLAGEVPAHSFGILREVAARARALLAGRSSEDVRLAADVVQTIIGEYMNEYVEQAIETVLDSGHPDQFEIDQAGRRVIKSEVLAAIEVPDVSAGSLKAVIDSYDFDTGAMPGVRPHELFAALALDLVAGALQWQGCVGSETSSSGRIPASISLAAEWAVKAMEAVCEGEAALALHAQASVLQAVAKAKGKRQTSSATVAAQTEKRRIQELVLAEWDKERTRRGVEAAGIHLAEWLRKQHNIVRSPRVISGWISKRAQLLGIRFK